MDDREEPSPEPRGATPLSPSEELRDLLGLYRLIVNHSRDAITLSDLHARILLASPAWEVLFGYRPEDVVGTDGLRLVHPEDVDAVREALATTQTTGQGFMSDLRLRHKDGRWVEVEAAATLIRGDDGSPRMILTTTRDVAERKQAQRRLAARTAVTRILAESATVTEASTRVLDVVCTMLDWDVGAIWRVDPDEGLVRCVHVRHPGSVKAPVFVERTRVAAFPPGVGLPGRVWQSRQPQWIEDVVTDGNFPRAPAAEADGLHSAFGFPILLAGRVLGVMEFFTRERRRPDDALLQVMAIIGSQMGQFLQRKEAEEQLAFQKALLESQSEAAIDGILVVGADGGILSFNRRFVDMWDIPEDVIASRSDQAAIGSVLGKLVDPSGFLARVEYLYAHPEERGRDEIELLDGRVFDRFTSPVTGADGTDYGRVWFFRDITSQKRQEQDLRFLADATEVLSSSLDPDTTLDEIARLSVSHLTDWCTTYLAREDGSIARTTTRHVDPQAEEILRRHGERFTLDPSAATGVPRVIRTGEPELHPQADARMLASDVDDPEGQTAILSSLGVTSWMCVPLVARGATLGAISFISTTSGRRYSLEDLKLATELARRAALAIDNARLHEGEVRARQEAERAAARTARLQAVTAALSEALTPAQVAEVVVREGLGALWADAGAVFVLDEEGQRFHLLASTGYPKELDERWTSFPADMPGPARDAVRLGDVVAVESAEELAARWPNLAEAQAQTGDQATLTAPLPAEGRTAGVLHVVFRTPRRVDEEDRRFTTTLARQCAQALERARLYEREHQIAETLQRSLLPERLPRVEGLSLAARYEPGSPATEVGGDWYDAMAFPDGTLGLVVGDVCGRGMEAASAMSQFRNALRAYASLELPPGEVLDRLNEMVDASMEHDLFATLVYAVIDPATGTVRFANAGHPPPLLRRADGTTRLLEEPSSVPVGAFEDAVYEEGIATLDPGSTLLLYTDGLVEDRSLPIGDGLERLATEVAAGPAELEPLLDHVLARLVGPAGRADDVAILGLVRVPARRPLRLTLPPDVRSLAGLRGSLRSWLAEAGVPDGEAYEIVVACNEACANAIEHSGARPDGSVEVELDLLDGEVVATVRDPGRWRSRPPDPERGLGLQVIQAFMGRIELRTGPGGTEVRMRRMVRREGAA